MNKHLITIYYSEHAGWFWYPRNGANRGYADHGPFKTESLARKDSDFRRSVGSSALSPLCT
jgi:hypothetical protein